MASVVIDTKSPEILLRLTVEEAKAVKAALANDENDETDQAFWALDVALDAHGAND